jgi:hypothetical protein
MSGPAQYRRVFRAAHPFVAASLCAALLVPTTGASALLIHAHDDHAVHTHVFRSHDHAAQDEAHDRHHSHPDGDDGFDASPGGGGPVHSSGEDSVAGAGLMIPLPGQPLGRPAGGISVVAGPAPSLPGVAALPAPDALPVCLPCPSRGDGSCGGRLDAISDLLQRSHAILI